jgi:peptide deformylase
MSDTTLDTLVIDTGLGQMQEQRIDPLPLFDENHPMLKVAIPEYKTVLPNPIMEKIVKRLKMTMKLYGGIGLSANQCGVFERVFIIGTDHFQIECINPKIIAASEDKVKESEGCLSYPGLFVKIERPSWIDVEFTDQFGQLKQLRLDGVTARCFEHELDHMNGIRMVDHVGPVALQMAKKKQEKIIKKIIRHKKK